ncbi:MAG: hypothetical protein ACJZ14_05115 [Candidatus Neomarinimicrobiota bacterium]
MGSSVQPSNINPAGKILNKKETQVIQMGVIHFISPINPKISHEIGSPNVMDHQSFD